MSPISPSHPSLCSSGCRTHRLAATGALREPSLGGSKSHQAVSPDRGWAASPGSGDERRDEPRRAGGSEAVPGQGGGQGWVRERGCPAER